MRRTVAVLRTLTVVAVFFQGSAFSKSNEGQPAKATGGDPKAAKSKEVAFKVSANELAREFLADPKKAFDKYKGKTIEVEGGVEFANKLIGDDKGFTLNGAKKDPKDVLALNIFCVVPAAHKEKAWWLGKGQKVKVVGELYNANSLAVYIKDSDFSELEPSPTATVSAQQMTADFAKDEAAAKNKYLNEGMNPKEVIVEGVVADLVTKPGSYIVVLEGTKPVSVACATKKEELDGLKKGDKVTMKGDCSLFTKNDNMVNLNAAFILKKN
jgi:hypothetical protein